MGRQPGPASAWFPWLIAAAGVACFAVGLPAPLVFDDRPAILENKHRLALWPPGRALSAPAQSPLAGRPVPALSLALNHALAGDDPRGYRAFNLAVHVLAGLALYGVVRRTLRGRVGLPDATALTAALLWLLHPVQTECVNYVTQRTESLMSLFYLLTLYASIRAGEGHGRRFALLAVAACAAGMASKESMVTAPLAVAGFDLACSGAAWREVVRRRAGLWAALAATWLLLAALLAAGPRSHTVGLGLGVAAGDYARAQCAMLVHYARLIVWPWPLALDYGQPEPVAWADVAGAALVLALLLGGAVLVGRRHRPAGFALAWFFLLLAPTSSCVPITSEVGADRRMYLALAGPLVLAVVAGRRLRPARARPGLAALALGLCAWGSVARSLEYRQPIRLWQRAVQAWPANARAHNNLGAELELAGRREEAERHYRRAIELKPDYPGAHHNLGNVLSWAGHQQQAIAEYRTALRLAPDDASAHNDLGIALQIERRYEEALAHHRRALELDPRMFQARENLERAERALGRRPAGGP
jgi:tetratricopeptide (TPR) repeat protein